jgi:ribosomal protein S18 acetylase RimI-like enzyme
VDRKFHGQPPGPSEQRYASQILSDLVAEAKRHEDERPILILYVNEQNHRAIRFYERFSFIELQKPYTDPVTGWVNKRMALVLKGPAGQSAPAGPRA